MAARDQAAPNVPAYAEQGFPNFTPASWVGFFAPAKTDPQVLDGFRVIAREDGARVRLYSRRGKDLTYRFPLIVEALTRLRSFSCIIDGEAVACDHKGTPSFDWLRYRQHDDSVFLYAFDLIELTGDDRRRDPLEQRKLDLIPSPIDQNSCAHWRNPRDMMRQG